MYVSVSVCAFRLEELVKAFLGDPDPDVTLSLGPDMRKIQYCFSLLKVMYLLWSFHVQYPQSCLPVNTFIFG